MMGIGLDQFGLAGSRTVIRPLRGSGMRNVSDRSATHGPGECPCHAAPGSAHSRGRGTAGAYLRCTCRIPRVDLGPTFAPGKCAPEAGSPGAAAETTGMGVLRRDTVRCLIREYDQLTCDDTVSAPTRCHQQSIGECDTRALMVSAP
jgi:hypothetical protein